MLKDESAELDDLGVLTLLHVAKRDVREEGGAEGDDVVEVAGVVELGLDGVESPERGGELFDGRGVKATPDVLDCGILLGLDGLELGLEVGESLGLLGHGDLVEMYVCI